MLWFSPLLALHRALHAAQQHAWHSAGLAPVQNIKDCADSYPFSHNISSAPQFGRAAQILGACGDDGGVVHGNMGVVRSRPTQHRACSAALK